MLKNCLFFFLFTILISNKLNAQANQYDVVIDEIMADPTPQIGLPTNEWIEIRNTSQQTFNLKGWRIGDESGQSGAMPSYDLEPDSVVIICTGSAVAAMKDFGKTISVTSFPSMDNTGDVIYLKSLENKIIHAVHYSDTWYQNELKKDGGWSLEMIDIKNPCSGFSNWKASTDLSGGTPGKKNSVDAVNNDDVAPKLLRAYASDDTNITLFFNEPVDSLKGATINNYSITNGIGTPVSAVAVAPVFDKVNLKLSVPLLPNTVYTITATGIADCANNNINNSDNTARTGLSVIADSLDIVINEILFNATPTGTDYVEIYNRSNKIIDLKQLFLANRNSNGEIAGIVPFSEENHLLFPGDYLVATENPAMVKTQFIAKAPEVL
ncbi:MAG: lamin tail domain-containing protein [Chitinophagaceae bacterium]|nr:lamin tail domain-containing protein [Chitinophagaceae bacterium]